MYDMNMRDVFGYDTLSECFFGGLLLYDTH